MLLEHGQIKEYGPREQLARDTESAFHHLLQLASDETLPSAMTDQPTARRVPSTTDTRATQ
jgi:hypothetical protein